MHIQLLKLNKQRETRSKVYLKCNIFTLYYNTLSISPCHLRRSLSLIDRLNTRQAIDFSIAY